MESFLAQCLAVNATVTSSIPTEESELISLLSGNKTKPGVISATQQNISIYKYLNNLAETDELEQ